MDEYVKHQELEQTGVCERGGQRGVGRGGNE